MLSNFSEIHAQTLALWRLLDETEPNIKTAHYRSVFECNARILIAKAVWQNLQDAQKQAVLAELYSPLDTAFLLFSPDQASGDCGVLEDTKDDLEQFLSVALSEMNSSQLSILRVFAHRLLDDFDKLQECYQGTKKELLTLLQHSETLVALSSFLERDEE